MALLFLCIIVLRDRCYPCQVSFGCKDSPFIHCLLSGTVEGVLSSSTARNMAILQYIPFVVPFKDRVKVWLLL